MSISSSDSPSSRPSSFKRSSLEMGLLAEAVVAQWLSGQGWKILQRRWHCRQGELDLIAYAAAPPPTGAVNGIAAVQNSQALLAFIEVKARSRGNWDADGLLAITPRKQAKLVRTAQWFLSTQPQWAEIPCRFDVALVQCQRLSGSQAAPTLLEQQSIGLALDPALIPKRIQIGQPVTIAGYRLSLQHYIQAAFD